MTLPLKGHRSHDRDARHTRAAGSQGRQGRELAKFLNAARELAVAEEGTVTWYAFKINDASYGIFDSFTTDEARTAHINGQIPAALANASGDLLASAPDIRFVTS